MKEWACGVSGKPAALRVEKRESEDFAWDAVESEVGCLSVSIWRSVKSMTGRT